MSTNIQQETIHLVNEINNKCEVEVEGLTFQDLATRQWYVHVLGILCDYLSNQLAAIEEEEDEAKAINDLLLLINELDEFDDDITEEIRGEQIVRGNPEQIFYMVQVIAALVDAAVKQNEEGEQVSEERSEENQSIQQAAKVQNKPKLTEVSLEREKRSLSQDDKLNRSVQGIRNEFEGESEEQDESEKMFKQDNNKIYPQMVESIQNNRIDFESPKQKNSMPFQENENESSVQYLDQKLSETKIVKKKFGSTAKSLKKNPQRNELIYGNKKIKKLVSHPKTPKTLKKAKSQNMIEMTNQIQQQIKKTKKKVKKNTDPIKRAKSPVEFELQRKNKEAQYAVQMAAIHRQQSKNLKKKQKNYNEKNDKQLMKILNWREAKMKRERKEYEQSMKMKVQLQKEVYVKQINDLIIKLEKEKEIEEKKLFKENLIQQNDEAVKRMTALEQWYRDKLTMLKQNRKKKGNERKMIKTGHREIISQIEKQLKKQNEEKLMNLTRKYRSEEQNVQNDLEELTQKIIKVYKKN